MRRQGCPREKRKPQIGNGLTVENQPCQGAVSDIHRRIHPGGRGKFDCGGHGSVQQDRAGGRENRSTPRFSGHFRNGNDLADLIDHQLPLILQRGDIPPFRSKRSDPFVQKGRFLKQAVQPGHVGLNLQIGVPPRSLNAVANLIQLVCQLRGRLQHGLQPDRIIRARRCRIQRRPQFPKPRAKRSNIAGLTDKAFNPIEKGAARFCVHLTRIRRATFSQHSPIDHAFDADNPHTAAPTANMARGGINLAARISRRIGIRDVG